ncbi:MAG: hypothetical protein IKQ49_12500 [Eubacterium sp.]|nr:hypothetical protein [Eubacterium sp.]
MSDTSKKALIALLGILIVVAAYMYVFQPAQDDIDMLDAEITSLKSRLADLTEKEQHKAELEAEIVQFNQEFEEELKNYPADLEQENTLMFLKGVEENNEFVNLNFSMPKPSSFYTLGKNSNQTDALTGEETQKEQPYVAISSSYSIAYDGTYEGLKSVLQYVADYRYRMNISSFDIAYDQDTDKAKGSVVLNGYAITGPGREANKVDLGLPTGTSNLFIAGNGSNTSAARGKYDSDNGASIVVSNNLMILLNSANSDLSSGIIVASNANREETYVTSNENSKVDLNISVYSEDGKNFVKYAIGDKSYVTEVLTEDVAVYVKSSARVDADDANGVNVTIMNTSTLPVFFKVVDDDATSPRFEVVNRSGSVKVYK